MGPERICGLTNNVHSLGRSPVSAGSQQSRSWAVSITVMNALQPNDMAADAVLANDRLRFTAVLNEACSFVKSQWSLDFGVMVSWSIVALPLIAMTWSRISRRQLRTHRFRSPVLPRCLNTRALRSETRRLQEGKYIRIDFRVVVEDGITIETSFGKRFT